MRSSLHEFFRFYWFKDAVYNIHRKEYYQVVHTNVNNFLQATNQAPIAETTDPKLHHLFQVQTNESRINSIVDNFDAAEKSTLFHLMS